MKASFLSLLILLVSGCKSDPEISLIEWYENGNLKKIQYDNLKKDFILQIGGTNEIKRMRCECE